MLKWRVSLPGEPHQSRRTHSNTILKSDIRITEDSFPSDLDFIPAPFSFSSEDKNSFSNHFPMDTTITKTTIEEREIVLPKDLVVLKPLRRRYPEIKRIVRVEVHSDDTFENDNETKVVHESDSVTLADDAEEDGPIGDSSPKITGSNSSSEDSIIGRRTSIANGFTNLVIEAAFETSFRDDDGSNSIYDLTSSGNEKVNVACAPLVRPSTPGFQKQLPADTPRLLKVSGNNTDEDIYSEACMLFDSESTIYEKYNGQSSKVNRSSSGMNFSDYCDSRLLNTISRSSNIDEEREEEGTLRDARGLGRVNLSYVPESQPSLPPKTLRTLPLSHIRASFHEIPDSPERINVPEPRDMSKSAEDLLCEAPPRLGVRFEPISVSERKKKKMGSPWDKINFTGSLGKRRGRFLNSSSIFTNDETKPKAKSRVVDESSKLSQEENFSVKRYSSDSQLLDSNKVSHSADPLNDNESENSSVANGRSETVNSSFRQRISKFFQDCPKYPLNNRLRRSSSARVEACSSSSAISEAGRKKNGSQWPFRVKLIKMEKVATNSVVEEHEKCSRSPITSITKNIYKITPKSKMPVETAKFYVDYDKNRLDLTKEPLHDVQFFHTPRVKLKPPDNSTIVRAESDDKEKEVRNCQAKFDSTKWIRRSDRVQSRESLLENPEPRPRSKSFGGEPKWSQKAAPVETLPRTIFLTQIASTNNSVLSKVAVSITARYETLSREANHTFPKRRPSSASNSRQHKRSSSAMSDSAYEPVGFPLALGEVCLTSSSQLLDALPWNDHLRSSLRRSSLPSLSGGSTGAVASVTGTSVGITTSYPQKSADNDQTKQANGPSLSQTQPCSSQSQKSASENSIVSSSKSQLSGSNSAVYSSGQSNSRASSELTSLSPRSLSSDFDGPSEHSIFTSSNGHIPSSNGQISFSKEYLPSYNDNNYSDQFSIPTSNESKIQSNISATGRLQGSSDGTSPQEYSEASTYSARGYTEALSDGFFDPSSSTSCAGLSALGVSASEDRDSLMWCSDADFDSAVSNLSMKGLIELVQSLQDAMVVEQQTFDTLTLQLETTSDPVVQQRLSAALCTSQTRLARLCARNMRCFSQQSLKARHKESSPHRTLPSRPTSSRSSNVSKTTITHSHTDPGFNNPALDYNFGQNAAYDSRAASPRDSGLAVSSTNGSDGEDFKSTSGSPSPPPSVSGAAFKNSLAFFQKAAHLVVNNAKNAQTGARQKDTRRRRSGTSSSGIDSACSDSASEDLHSRSLDRMGERRPRLSGASSDEGRHHQTASRTRSLGREGSTELGQMSSDEGSYLGSAELPADAGTYEQVLFINGRPQYQDDFRRSYSCEALDSWTNTSVSPPTSTTTVKINLSSSGSSHRSQKPHKSKHYNNFSSPSRHSSSTSSSTISSDGGWTRVVLDGTSNKNNGYNNTSSTSKKSSQNCYGSNKSNSTDKPQAAAVKCRSSASSSASSGGNHRPSGGASADSSSLTSAGSWVGGGSVSVRDSESDYALGYSSGATSDSASISVTLPRRKPYLNLQSVTTGSGSSVVNIYSSGSGGTGLSVSARREIDVSPCREFLPKVCGVNIQRSQSFKEGLDDTKGGFPVRSYPLTRTQSYNDGLSGELGDFDRPSLSRAPSIDEILESVRNLRVKKNMVKSSPDLYQNIGEPVYHSASMPRHKSSSKSKSSRSPGASGIIGVRYSSKSTEHVYDRVPEPHYEQIIEDGDPCYENIHKETSYENINHKSRKEVIYDRPKSNKAVESKYDQVPGDLLYENVSNYDLSVYENIADGEPTYMNVTNTNTNSSSRSKKSRSNKESSRSKSKSPNNQDLTGGQTYDIPRSATHIYDTPKKYSRSVSSAEDFSEYATPRNNRSVTPGSLDSIQLAKQDQKKKIDDIFAEVDRNVYDDDLPDDRHHPSIPPPDYGAEDEYSCSQYPDEGLGECEGRPYYAEEQGLEVILEEPEEDYCSSPVSHLGEEYPRESNLRLRLKAGERGSLDGSEGIGSAEGDSSGGGSDHYNEEEEEDCASSGIHSQDTPSPSTPIDHYKEDTSDGHQLRHEERIQKDRSIDVYPETLRQRQRNMAPSPSKVDIKNWNQNEVPVRESSSPSDGKKFLPSVKALRSQFETGKSPNNGSSNGSVSPVSTFSNSSNGSGVVSGAPSKPSNRGDSATMLSRKLSGSSLASSSLEKSSSNTSLNSAPSSENLLDGELTNEPVEPIFCQFQKVDEELRELMSRPTSTSGWDPRLVLKRLYYIPEMPRAHTKGNSCVNIEGFLEKLPSGRKKATFWNAWKKRYFVAKDGVLYYYQNSQCDKPSLRLTLMGGKVETMEANMVGVDDGKGHYVVMRCSSKSEAERWRKALETHLVEDFASQYVQPQPMTTNPTLLRDTLIIDIGSCSIRAGVLASQATLPQVFFPTVLGTDRESRRQYWGPDAVSPEVRSSSSISFPIRPSHRISKYSVDLTAVSSLLSKVFSELKVDPRNYNLQISVPRVLNQHTQSELIKILFEKFGVKGVNITHQSILALYAYNATSGIVVDIGERMDIVPVTDGYIIDGGVSRVPYGGYRILDHLRQFLHMRNVSLVNDVESYIIRHVLESACYCAQHYNTEKARCSKNPENFEKSVSLKEFFSNLAQCPYESVELDFGRFQATEGLFNPDAWGLDHPGLHKLVHKAIQECSMDIRKEMSRSIFLAGGVTQLPGLADRLTAELDNLTPPAIRPKVHASPYRYHAAFIGACTLAESAAFPQSVVTKENWLKNGNAALRKWAL